MAFDWIKTVILALPKGFYTSIKHVFKRPVTRQYPYKKHEMFPRYRGKHYLEIYDDGTERCVCCGLCAAACPADCIYMEPAENEKGERYAKIYEINLLRCIYCGYCEEACPEEAIFLGHEYEFSDDNRNSFIYTKQEMLANRPKEKPFKKIIRKVRRIF